MNTCENSDDTADPCIRDSDTEIDSILQSLLEKFDDEVVYEDIFNVCLTDIIEEAVEQWKPMKKGCYTSVIWSDFNDFTSEEDMNCSDENSLYTPFDISVLSKIGWPKERILFARLELIVQTIEVRGIYFIGKFCHWRRDDQGPYYWPLNGNCQF